MMVSSGPDLRRFNPGCSILIRTLYTGTSLIRNIAPQGPYSRTMPRARWWSLGGVLFLISEVPLYIMSIVSTSFVTDALGANSQARSGHATPG